MRQNWQLWEANISPEFCDSIVDIMLKAKPDEATTFNNSGKLEQNSHRHSKVRWVYSAEVRKMLWDFAQAANKEFKFDIIDKGPVQFTEYSTEYSGKYDWHHDVDWNGNSAFDRKISVVVQLSDPNEYEDCDFHFNEVPNPDPEVIRKKGTVICFPSYLQHQVTEITKGTRYSLVAWFEGPRWR